MLRGYSRHCNDGISNKQSAKERDRDRQREKQRQEREALRMLPNDDKDINSGAQDLFHAPVKVEPSVEDRTTLEIRNTLGNFEHVKHYVVDGASGRNLIGVDQNSNPSHRQSSSRPSGSSGTHSKNPSIPSRNYSLPNPSNTSTPQNNLKASNIHKVPHTQNQPLHHSSQLGSSVHTSNSVLVPPTQFSVKKSSSFNNSSSSSSSTSSSANTNSNSVNSAAEVGGGHNISVTTTTPTIKIEKTLNNNNSYSVGSLSVSDTHSAEIVNEKTERGSHSSKKPALERVDSQLELESMIKEMMDVTPPITAIEKTPAKESPAKKYTPRRASKSEEKIIQIREGMTNIPSPIKKMDSSDSSSSDTESSSDSEDSSSGSQGGTENQDATIAKPPPATNSPTRWNLSSFIRKDNIKGTPDSSGTTTTIKSPKDSKSRENPHASNTVDSEESPGVVPIKLESSVTSTSVFGKSMSSSPRVGLVESASVGSKAGSKSSNIPHVSHLEVNEGPYSKVLGKSPRKPADVKADSFLPIKVPATTIPMKGSSASANVASKIASLSATSSEDEEEKPKEVVSRSIPQEKPRVGGKQGTTRKRPRHSSSSSERPCIKSDDDDSSPEADRTKKKILDRNKNATLTKLFQKKRKKERIDSPNRESDDSKAVANNSSRGKGGGKAKPSPSNRVPAKDTGRKGGSTSNSASTTNNNSSSLVHNGDLDSKANVKSSSSSAGKKRESSIKDTSSSHSSHHHGRKHGHKTHSGRDSHKNSNNEGAPSLINPQSAMVNIVNPSSAVMSRVKEDPGKSHPSTLMCRIPLNKLPRPPGSITTSANSAMTKSDKDFDKGLKDTSGHLVNSDSSHRVRLIYDSSRVGSSSDQTTSVGLQEPLLDRKRDDSMCSDSEEIANKNHPSRKRAKKKPRSPKKNSKIKHEPDSHSKNEDDSVLGCEVSSNVFGYTCDVSTTRTPPVELDVVQAPDSSINPLHLPSPAVPQMPIYYSYFDRNDSQHEDYYSRDQETYLEEAKRLKHKADNEKLGTTQASMYLEAGLYFILTGISMERDRNVGQHPAFTMYKDTLSLIRYIGTRFRSGNYSNVMEAKIIVLSMRCQSLLSLKLFKIKMRETKDVVQYLTEHFTRTPVDVAPIPNSPQLIIRSPTSSTHTSPHSPTSSPAGSSGVRPWEQQTPSSGSSQWGGGHTPSPHQNHHVVTVPRTIYSQMHKQCTNTMNLISAHELWDSADSLVERYHMEDFFISIDRQFGPLTLHNSLVDLVRYVKHGLKLLKIDIS